MRYYFFSVQASHEEEQRKEKLKNIDGMGRSICNDLIHSWWKSTFEHIYTMAVHQNKKYLGPSNFLRNKQDLTKLVLHIQRREKEREE